MRDSEQPFINSVLLNKEKDSYLRIFMNSCLKKENTNILDVYIQNIENMSSSKDVISKNASNSCLTKLKNDMRDLLNNYPEGVQLEKFNNSFQMYHGYFLHPQDYNFKDMIDLIKYFKDISLLKTINKNLYVVGTVSNATKMDDKEFSEEETDFQLVRRKVIPKEIKNVFKIILESFGGGVPLDNLLPEYEFRTGKKVTISQFGISSILELASLLGPNYKVCNVNGCQSVLYDSNKIHNCPCKCIPAEITKINTEDTTSDVNGKCFTKDVLNRLVYILTEEYPEGLTIDELVAAYKGFYDAYSEDLNPPKYGLQDFEQLLKMECGFLRFAKEQGKAKVFAGAFYQDRLVKQEPMHNVVLHPSSFEMVDASLIKDESLIEVIVADVYSPAKFWIIQRGKENSLALDELMDRMLVFYRSELGDTFKIPNHALSNLLGAPVVAFYSEDENYYRAILLLREDVSGVKLFFVDYGTATSAPISSLRYLHKKFFDFPTQAIKSSLYGIEPRHGKTFWPKSASYEFLSMARDKGFMAYVNENHVPVGGKLHLTLYDTTEENEDVNINFHLVMLGMASLSESCQTVKHKMLNSLDQVKEIDRTVLSASCNISSDVRHGTYPKDLLDGVGASLHDETRENSAEENVDTNLPSVATCEAIDTSELGIVNNCNNSVATINGNSDESKTDFINNSCDLVSTKNTNENAKENAHSRRRTICPSKIKSDTLSFSFRSLDTSLPNSRLSEEDTSSVNYSFSSVMNDTLEIDRQEENIFNHKSQIKTNNFNDDKVVHREGAFDWDGLLPKVNPFPQKKTSVFQKLTQDFINNEARLDENSLTCKAVLQDVVNRDLVSKSSTLHVSQKNKITYESSPLESVFFKEGLQTNVLSHDDTFRNEVVPNESVCNHDSVPLQEKDYFKEMTDFLNQSNTSLMVNPALSYKREGLSINNTTEMPSADDCSLSANITANNTHDKNIFTDSLIMKDDHQVGSFIDNSSQISNRSEIFKTESCLESKVELVQSKHDNEFDVTDSKSNLKDFKSSLMDNKTRIYHHGTKVPQSDVEVFYSDDEEGTNCVLNGDQDVISINLLNKGVVHVIRVNRKYFIPDAELPLLLQQSNTLNALNASTLRDWEEGNDPWQEITILRHPFAFVLLAWEKVPYIFTSKGVVAKRIRLLELQYLIDFMNTIQESDREIYKEFIKSFGRTSDHRSTDYFLQKQELPSPSSEDHQLLSSYSPNVIDSLSSLSKSEQKCHMAPVSQSVVSRLITTSSLSNNNFDRKEVSDYSFDPSASNKFIERKEQNSANHNNLASTANGCAITSFSNSRNEYIPSQNNRFLLNSMISKSSSSDAVIPFRSLENPQCLENNHLPQQITYNISDVTKFPPSTNENNEGNKSSADISPFVKSNSVISKTNTLKSSPMNGENFATCSQSTPTPIKNPSDSVYSNSISPSNESQSNVSYNPICYYGGDSGYLPATPYGQQGYWNSLYKPYPIMSFSPGPMHGTPSHLPTPIPPSQNYPYQDFMWHPYRRYASIRTNNIYGGYFPNSNRSVYFTNDFDKMHDNL